MFLWRTGVRIAEALALRPVDLDLQAGSAVVLSGKGDKRRVVGVPPDAVALLQLWLEQRRRLRIGPGRPLFCTISQASSTSSRGRALSQQYCRALCGRLREQAGVEKRVHPHGFRHTCASELIAEGVPLNLIQAQLGHASLHTTDRYTRHVNPAQVLDAMRARGGERAPPAQRPGPGRA